MTRAAQAQKHGDTEQPSAARFLTRWPRAHVRGYAVALLLLCALAATTPQSARADAAVTVTLTWDATTNAPADFDGYKLRYTPAAGGPTNIYMLLPTNWARVTVTPGLNYYWLTTVKGTNESAPSNVLLCGPDTPAAPTLGAPSNLRPFTNFSRFNVQTIITPAP